jgi:hypothetical protein
MDRTNIIIKVKSYKEAKAKVCHITKDVYDHFISGGKIEGMTWHGNWIDTDFLTKAGSEESFYDYRIKKDINELKRKKELLEEFLKQNDMKIRSVVGPVIMSHATTYLCFKDSEIKITI